MTTNIFLLASRQKLRFESPQGLLTVEDLWSIPLTTKSPNRASIEGLGANALARQAELERLHTESILGTSKPSAELENARLRVSILRDVASIRQAEVAARTNAAAVASERDRLDALIREREGSELSIEELKKRRAALDAAPAAGGDEASA